MIKRLPETYLPKRPTSRTSARLSAISSRNQSRKLSGKKTDSKENLDSLRASNDLLHLSKDGTEAVPKISVTDYRGKEYDEGDMLSIHSGNIDNY